jgi:hypothetical protein
MMKMSEIVDVQIRALNETQGQKVEALEREFESMVVKTKLKAPEWAGTVDQTMRNWLNKVTEFFEWKKAHNPKRRAEFTQVLRALDGPNRLLPAEIEERNVDLWMETKSYFDKIAHHGSDPIENDFLERMGYVESTLHNKLNPKTFADFDTVDALIEEGELQ